MSQPKILYTVAGGGMGDIVMTYYRRADWRRITDAKRIYPEHLVMGIVISPTFPMGELVSTCPHLDILYMPDYPGVEKVADRYWLRTLPEGARNLDGAYDIPERDNRMWLDPLERRIFDKLIGMGRYVVLAPYARQGERNCRPFCGKTGCFAEEKYVPLAECLCKLGWHVIIIGAQENGFPLPEVASCAGRCILNWVNNTSIRLAVEVIRNADGFIGPQSGPLAAAWSNKVPSVFFFPEGVHDRNWEILTGRFNGDWSWYTGVYCKDEPWVAWFMETPEGFAGLAPETVAMKLEEVMKRRVPL